MSQEVQRRPGRAGPEAARQQVPEQVTRGDATGAGRPIPTLDVDPVVLAVALSLLHPNDALVVAARLGVEMNEARRERRRTMREVSHQVHGGRPHYWRDWATHRVPHVELERRRGVEVDPDGRRRVVRRPADTRPDYPGRGAA